MSHHDQLKILLQQTRWQARSFTGKEISRAYLEAYGEPRIFPGQHAIKEAAEEKETAKTLVCRQCRTEGALLKAIPSETSAYPLYTVQPEALHGNERITQHQILERVLTGHGGKILWRGEQIRLLLEKDELLRQMGEDKEREINSLLGNLSQHTAHGKCKLCREGQALLKNTGFNQYLVLVGMSLKGELSFPDSESQMVSQDVLKRPLLAEDVMGFLKDSGAWREYGQSFLQYFSLISPAPQETELESAGEKHLSKDLMIQRFWKLQELKDWRELWYLYQEYVQDPALELIFFAVLPDRIKQAGVKGLKPTAFFQAFYKWFLGGKQRTHLNSFYEKLIANLPSEEELSRHLTWLESQVKSGNKHWIKTVFQTFPQQMNWLEEAKGKDGHLTEITGLVLTSSLLSLFWPEQCMTVSLPTLQALKALSELEDSPVPERLQLPDWRVDDLNPSYLAELMNWSQEECRERNARWGESFLTPRRLDMIMYSCRNFLLDGYQSYVKMKGGIPFRQVRPITLLRHGQKYLKDFWGISQEYDAIDFEFAFKVFENALEELKWREVNFDLFQYIN